MQTLYFYILVSGHSRKRPRTLSLITTWTFSLFWSSRKRTHERKSTTSAQYLVFNYQSTILHCRSSQWFYSNYSTGILNILIPMFIVSWVSPVSSHLSPAPLVAAYENHSRKRPPPFTDIESRGCPLPRASTVLPCCDYFGKFSLAIIAVRGIFLIQLFPNWTSM